MPFYVYENWTAEHKAVVHTGRCGYCNDGKGCHRLKLGKKNGRWLGPFPTLEKAWTAAVNTRRPARGHRCTSIGRTARK